MSRQTTDKTTPHFPILPAISRQVTNEMVPCPSVSPSISRQVTAEQVLNIKPPDLKPQAHFRRAVSQFAREMSMTKIPMADVYEAIKSIHSDAEVACLSSRGEKVIDNLTNLMEATFEEVRKLMTTRTIFILVEQSASCLRAVAEVLTRYSNCRGGVVIPVLMEQFSNDNPAVVCKKISTLVESGADDVVVLPASAADLSMTIMASLAKGKAHRTVKFDFEKKVGGATKQCDELFWRIAHKILPAFPEERRNMEEFPDRCIGNLTVVEKLGEGVFGTVLKCQNKESGKLCAVKVVPKARVYSHRKLEEVMTEYEVLKRVSHANVASGINFVHGVKNLYILMELAGSLDLFRTIQAEGARGMPWPKAKAWFLQIAAGVAHLHDQDIAHCDLKPENIAISDAGLKLVDFGLAIDVTGEIPELIVPRGTMPFIAPEVISLASEWDPIAGDLWQVGAILIEMLCGNHSLVKLMKWKRNDLNSLQHLAEHAEDLRVRFNENTKQSTLVEISRMGNSPLPPCSVQLLAAILELVPTNRLAARDVAAYAEDSGN
jgi:hypothetical protein